MSEQDAKGGVKERPILFSGPMVRAILEGRKTQTRLVVEPQPLYGLISGEVIRCHRTGQEFRCPYGVHGDLLYVKESYRLPVIADLDPPSNFRPGTPIWYEADGDADLSVWGRLRPSIHMPRWASRITLEVVSVRVERLQDISEADAKAEGVEPYRCPQADALMNAVGGGMKPIPYTSGFANLWNEINGKTYPWSSNPFVWVVEFKAVPV